MVESNLFCSLEDCGQPAVYFGFTSACTKLKVCKEHLTSLASKQLTLCSISDFNYLEFESDLPSFKQRREIMQKGLGIVTAMEAQCEADWTEGQKCIQTSYAVVSQLVLESYREMWVHGEQRYKEIKWDLGAKRRRMERLLEDKAFQLEAEDAVLFGDVQKGTLFRLAIGDCRAEVRETLMEHFHILPIESDAVVMNSNADLQRLLQQSSAFTESEIQQIAEISLQAGLESLQKGAVIPAIAYLNSGETLLRDKALQGASLWRRLCNSLAGTYYQAGKYTESMDICERTMQICSNDPLEWLTAMFYFILSNFFSKSSRKLQSQLQRKFDEMVSFPPNCRSLHIYITAFGPTFCENDTEMAGKLEEGLALGTQEQPQSYPTACARLTLGNLYIDMGRERQAEGELMKALEVFGYHYPFSADFGLCLNAMATIDVMFNRYQQAEERMLQAYQILTRFPQSDHFYMCVLSLYRFYNEREQATNAFSIIKAAIHLWKLNNDNFHIKECTETLNFMTI